MLVLGAYVAGIGTADSLVCRCQFQSAYRHEAVGTSIPSADSGIEFDTGDAEVRKLVSTAKLVIVVGLVTAGCSHNYTPNPDTFKSDPIADFKPSGEINVVNAQSSDADFLFASAGIHSYYGRLNEWTDAAVAIAKKELEKRGMVTALGAKKTLSMSITRANSVTGFWVVRGEISLMVKTGDGHSKTFFADNRSPASLFRAIDGAVMRAVVAALNDKKIVEYLEKGKAEAPSL